LWLRVLEEVDSYVSEKLAAVIFNVDVSKHNADVHLQAHRVYESGRPYLREMVVIQW
jgi:hypothetical protein